MRWKSVLAVMPLILAACASGGTGAAGAPNRSVLTQEELAVSGFDTAYEAIERSRPEWLRSRGTISLMHGTAEYVVVYVDRARFGEMSTLRDVRVTDIREIRYLSGPEATTRYGAGHAGGVIHILLK
jgi:hypothetical protein